MAPFRPVINFARELWFALDTASALFRGGTASEEARRYISDKPFVEAAAPQAQPAA